MNLDQLPSVIRNHTFTENGLAHNGKNLLVPVYIGNQMGFHAFGKKCLDEYFYPQLKAIGILPLCPFTACAEYLNPEQEHQLKTIEDQQNYWNRFNEIINVVNYETLIPRAKMMIALMDGGHSVDDGLAAEISYFATHQGPVAGIRSDIRLADNLAAPVNVAIRYFLDKGPYKGYFFCGNDAYERAFTTLEELAQNLLKEEQHL